MNIKLDENLPLRIAVLLRDFGHDVHTLREERLHSPNRTNLIARIQELYTQENVEKWAGCFVVATERKVRVLRPKS
jgi:hypothetical protein